MILFLKRNEDVVAVVLVVWKIPDVPKFVPVDDALR
jgi:hypothetical protein